MSLFLIVLAVALVGTVGIFVSQYVSEHPDEFDIDPEDEESGGGSTSVLGIVLLLVAQCFTGGQFIVEEKLLDGYYLDPFLVVGLEGMWGCLIYAIVLPLIQATFSENCYSQFCTYGYLEDSALAFE